MVAINWKQAAIRSIRRMTRPFRMEEIRHRLAARNVFATKPNAWGGLTRDLLKDKLLERVETQVSKDQRNHSRVWLLQVRGR